MKQFLDRVKKDMATIVSEWENSGHLKAGQLFVIGCSTSEVAGEHIGTSGSEEIAAVILEQLEKLEQATGIHLVFQCCEHLNRALVIDRELLQNLRLDDVAVIPVAKAGGSMAAYAYKQKKDPVVVETIHAHAGMDIGDTMIGMHLKHVAVPLRFEQKMVGEARVTGARTRPKLVGGVRACYK
ncbi:TIGR01440 family protein [Virgibacillus sp. W0181]|uniref:TIGR01440 family protein n=1 Tax=Virgibacillus sp. W0181 TaxID=3391581 RepID=UPI003F45EAD2